MLARAHRFHGLHSLDYVYKKGSVVRGEFISLRYARNDRQTGYRVAVVVSKKVHKSAVVRNRIRRRLYEVLRAEIAQLTQPYDIVLTVYNVEVATVPANTLRVKVRKQLTAAGLV